MIFNIFCFISVNGNDDVLGVSAAASTVSVRPGEQVSYGF